MLTKPVIIASKQFNLDMKGFNLYMLCLPNYSNLLLFEKTEYVNKNTFFLHLHVAKRGVFSYILILVFIFSYIISSLKSSHESLGASKHYRTDIFRGALYKPRGGGERERSFIKD